MSNFMPFNLALGSNALAQQLMNSGPAGHINVVAPQTWGNMINTAISPHEITASQLPPQIVSFIADYSGCGFYRCLAPDWILSLEQKLMVHQFGRIVPFPDFFQDIRAIRCQRQISIPQTEYIRWLKQHVSSKFNTRIIYEIDDVVFAKYIPLYNKNRDPFLDPIMQQKLCDVLKNVVDEITVTTEYFRDLIIDHIKCDPQKVTVIPNCIPRFWLDRYYNPSRLVQKFQKQIKRPHIGIFASGAHVDIFGRNRGIDDFTPVLEAIIKTRKNYVWHFYGAYPLQILPYIQSGEMKAHPWCSLIQYPQVLAQSEVTVTFACLLDNEFNNSKSNIKLLEAGAMGLPCICPDLAPYKMAPLKYKTADEFIDRIKQVTKTVDIYSKHVHEARKLCKDFWLEDEKNYMKFYEALVILPQQRRFLIKEKNK